MVACIHDGIQFSTLSLQDYTIAFADCWHGCYGGVIPWGMWQTISYACKIASTFEVTYGQA
eukprot:scaffold59395_cov35-Prasinocladus_malaysianus.AAC.3